MRILVGLLLIAHGVAHAAAGTWAANARPIWLVTVLWWIASAGFVAGGLGILGARTLRATWWQLSPAAATASVALLAFFWSPVFLPGIAIDAAVLIAVIRSRTRLGPPSTTSPSRWKRFAGHVAVAFTLLYLSAVILLRPWHTRWGTTAAERAMPLPGDEVVAVSHYRMDHAITIHAPADAVWPWLVQIGQDRGGFYSYSWLERMVGDEITNADRIHPEWQTLRRGDLVRAAQRGYLGGILGDEVGWRVLRVEPGRAIVLEGWGAFVIRPVDASTSRLHIRLRGDGRPSVVNTLLAPVGLLVFEPTHFIMERGMMRGIRTRAERAMPLRRAAPFATRSARTPADRQIQASR